MCISLWLYKLMDLGAQNEGSLKSKLWNRRHAMYHIMIVNWMKAILADIVFPSFPSRSWLLGAVKLYDLTLEETLGYKYGKVRLLSSEINMIKDILRSFRVQNQLEQPEALLWDCGKCNFKFHQFGSTRTYLLNRLLKQLVNLRRWKGRILLV